MKTITNQHATSSALAEDIAEKLESSMKKIYDEHQALKSRHKDIIDRQEALVYQHGGENSKTSDIIRLNVRGTEVFARRDTLTGVKGSRLEALFSGRWENRLLRDGYGRVIMDVDPDMFKKILEYLYMVKISEDTMPPLPEVIEAKKGMFDMYVGFFKLRSGNGKATPEAVVAQERVSSTMEEKEMMAKMKQELDLIDQRLENEESFVETKKSGIGDEWVGDKFDDSSCFSYKSDALSSTDNKKSAVENDIINLYLNGEIVAYRVDTLCGGMTSKLASDLSNDTWVRERVLVTENGKTCILMEYPVAEFKALVEYFHLNSITDDRSMKVPVSDISDYMSRFIKHFYSDDDEMVRSLFCSNIDSTVISSQIETKQIKEWLLSAGKTSKPKLLYRASRDGWDASDFHRMCDGKGATVTAVRSSAGYIFGGYTDVVWGKSGKYQYSTASFLFSLKDHAGVGPVKMPIKTEEMGNAAFLSSKYHSLSRGQTFGRGHDLYVASDSNKNASSYCDVGFTYQLPCNTDNPFFLTGSKHFTLSEHEVFLV